MRLLFRTPNVPHFPSRAIRIRSMSENSLNSNWRFYAQNSDWVEVSNSNSNRQTTTRSHIVKPNTNETEYKVSCGVRGSTVCFSAVTFSVPYRRHHHWMQSEAHTRTFAKRLFDASSTLLLLCFSLFAFVLSFPHTQRATMCSHRLYDNRIKRRNVQVRAGQSTSMISITIEGETERNSYAQRMFPTHSERERERNSIGSDSSQR